MDLMRAFTYIFDDPQWVGKVVMVGLLSFLAAILMPLLGLGLAPLAILLGYMMEIVSNVREGSTLPLPAWNDYGARLERGSNILVAVVVYNLPVMLMTCCIAVVPSTFGGDLTTGIVSLLSLCCVLPLLVLYIAVTWPMLATGVGRYARSGRSSVFFQFGKLYETSRSVGTYSLQLLLAVIAVNMLFWLIPCIGWIASLVVGIPVFGHLTGQYMQRIDAAAKRGKSIA